MFKIDKGIPYPPQEGTGGRPKYPFADLEVGDSFFAPGVKASTLINAAQWHSKRYGKTFTCKSEQGGARCWRLA